LLVALVVVLHLVSVKLLLLVVEQVHCAQLQPLASVLHLR
jgi:hypothetical protein